MKPCIAKLPDGTPCPNQVDEGQKYCPFHLASQDADVKKKLFNMVEGLALGAFAAGIYKAAKTGIVTVAKFVASKRL